MAGLRRAFLALWLGLAVAPAAAETLTLDIPAARALAEQAVLGGNPALARQIALGLLQRDPNDPQALLALAAADILLGQPALARASAARAFRASGDRPQRYQAARLAAKAAFDAGRLGLAQFWLRRALDQSPDAQSYQDTVVGFRQVQAQNRWRTNLQFSAQPTTNANQGSSADRLIIDGVPTILTFSGDAMALPGLTYGGAVGVTYVLDQTPKSRTELGLRLVANGVALSDAARRQAPGATNGDYAYQAVEGSLTHRFVLGKSLPLAATALVGSNFYGGAHLTDYARLQLDLATRLAGPQTLGWQVLAERQWPLSTGRPVTVLALEGRYDRQLTSGDRVGLQVGLVRQGSRDVNAENLALTARLSYGLARRVGPAEVGFSLCATQRDYPVYFSNIFNRNGRQDLKLGLGVDLTFPAAQVWGFAPTLGLSASHTWSNISRYEQDEFGVRLGLKSLF